MYFNKKMLLVTILAIIIPLMAVGYAALQQKLVISGTSHVDSNWQIEIISVTESDIVGDAKDKVAPSYTGTTAKFKVSLINPTDSITYNVKIKNLGTLDARIKKLNIDIGESDAIIYDVNLVKNDGTTVNLASNNEINQTNINNTKNTTLSPNEEQTVKLKVTFKEGYIGQPDENNSSNTIKMTIDYVQNFKDSNGEQILPSDERAYSIGDKVTFAGSDWYVIEDSPDTKDYVVLLKNYPLTVDEVYNYGQGHINRFTEAKIGEVTDTSGYGGIVYHSSETCGYINGKWNVPNCKISYDIADIKYVVDNYGHAINSNNYLKNINGYSIRLITLEELQTNLGYTNGLLINDNLNVPNFVHNYNYWTMSYFNSGTTYVVHNQGNIAPRNMNSSYDPTIRPVINLYKTAIE